MKYLVLCTIIFLSYGCISRYNLNNENNFSDKLIKIENTNLTFPLPNNFKYLTILNDSNKKTTIINKDENINISFTALELVEDSHNSFEEIVDLFVAYKKSPNKIYKQNIKVYEDKKYIEIVLEEDKFLYLASYKNEYVEINTQCERTNKSLTKEIIEKIIKYLK